MLKLLTVLGDATFLAFIGVALALAVGGGAWLTIQAAGGVDALKSEVASLQSPSTASSAPPPPPAATEPEASPAPPVEQSPPPVEPSPPAEPAPPVEPAQPAEPEEPRDRET